MALKITKQWVRIRFEKEGYHMYPGSDTDPKLATGDQYDVSHLALRHMHYFKFEVQIEVFHDDRDIEFIQFRRWCENLFTTGVMEADYKSCEMLAVDLANLINKEYPGRDMKIIVSEDGMNDGIVEFVAEDAKAN